MVYRVKLQNFEGPLDLLLFLIRKNEVDIYDIPIALITRQYLEYIQLMQNLDLEIASEFILMAATLIRVKVQFLLPQPEMDEDLADFDPRQELVDRLLEYRKFKEISFDLSRRESKQMLYHRRVNPDQEVTFVTDDEPSIGPISLFDLLSAFREVYRRLENQSIHQIVTPSVSVEEQIDFIESFIKDRERISFSELMQHAHTHSRSALVATFVALLELIRSRVILIKQSEVFGEIWIFNKSLTN